MNGGTMALYGQQLKQIQTTTPYSTAQEQTKGVTHTHTHTQRRC